MKALKLELMETLANELNNNDWTFDGYRVSRAAVDHKTGEMWLALFNGKEIIDISLTAAHRRNHGRKRPQARNRSRTTGLRRKKPK